MKKSSQFFYIFIFLAFVVFAGITWLNWRQIKLAGPKLPADLSGQIDPSQKIAVYEGQKIEVPEVAISATPSLVLGATSANKWIEVDLSEQKVRAWEGGSLFLESLISTGLPWWPTPTGEFFIWAKARATKMEGGSGKYYYNLPNVPYVMFFENAQNPGFRGFSLHGTYWHNDFGKVHSHGCVNLPTPIAARLYAWTEPAMPDGKSFLTTSGANPGTRIVIHD
jgi:lipoprotein-anchoring transpeptidase ErfK/SrfK